VLLRRTARLSLVLFGLLAVSAPAVAAAKTALPHGAQKLPASRLKHVGRVVCARLGSSTQWVPGTLVKKKYFLAHEKQSGNYAKLARKAKGKKRKKLNAAARRYRKLAKAQRSRCYFPRAAAPTTPLRFDMSHAAGLALTPSGATVGTVSRGVASAATAGSNLVTVDGGGGTHDAVSSGTAAISRFLIAPDGKVYVAFSRPVDLQNASANAWSGTGCVLAAIDRASGTPSCVDADLGYINSMISQGGNSPIQFDGAGAIYYSGSPKTLGKTVLRRYLNGTTTDLINDNIMLNDFLVGADGSVFMSGRSSTGAMWVRRIARDGGLQNLGSSNTSFLQAFPDGNVYMSVNGESGVRRYLTGAKTVESKYWIAFYGSNEAYFNFSDLCPSGSSGSCGISGSMIRGTYRTADRKVFVVGDSMGRGVLLQYFPTLQAPITAVKSVSVAQSAGTDLVLAGVNDQGHNVMMLHDTSTGNERQLIGADNEIEVYHVNYVASGNKVMFDGLRFADNRYVLGQVDLSTGAVTVSATNSGKWADFQTFG
jgi:hypothetical protein